MALPYNAVGCFVVLKIKQFAEVQVGYSFRSRLEVSKDGEISVIQMKDLLQDNTVGCEDLVSIDMEAIKEHHLAQKGDLVFRSRGQTTTSAILLEDPGTAIVAAPLLRIRVTKFDRVLPEYLNWYISQRDAQIFLASRAKGTVQKMISKEVVEELEVYVPALQLQEHIVDLANLSARERIIRNVLTDKRGQYIQAELMQVAKG